MDISGAKVVFFVEWTEYERDELGCSQRPDGMTYAINKDKLQTEIKRQVDLGTPDYYNRPSSVMQGLVNDALYEKIQTSESGVVNTMRSHDAGFLGKFSPSR